MGCATYGLVWLPDYIAFDPATGKARQRAIRYRLSDNYTRFYLRYVEPVRQQVRKGLYQRSPLETLNAWNTIVALQFENLVLQSTQTLLRSIGLENVPVMDVGPYWQSQTARRKACQVDVMVRTKGGLYVFEVKFRKTIPKRVVSEMQQKVQRLKLPESLSVRTGLIYDGELHGGVTKSDYFGFPIPFERLLEAD